MRLSLIWNWHSIRPRYFFFCLSSEVFMLKALLWAWSSGFHAVSAHVHLFMSTTKAGLTLSDKEKKMTVYRTKAPLQSQQPFCCFYGDIPPPGFVSGSIGMFLSSPNLLECNNSSGWKNVLNAILYSDR